MSILPVLTATKILKALLHGGFVPVRQIGSHVQLRHPKDARILVTVAKHNRDITKKGLASILKQARLTVDENVYQLMYHDFNKMNFTFGVSILFPSFSYSPPAPASPGR